MARKMNNSKMSQETGGQPAAGNQQPMPPTTAFYQAQLRQQTLKAPPKARVQIAIEIEEQPQTPREIEIIHTEPI